MLNNLISNLTIGNIIPWLLLGIVSAFIVHLIDQRELRNELWRTTLAGVVGALIGGVITSLFIKVDLTGVNIASFIMATLGGLLFSSAERLIGYSKEKEPQVNEPRYDYESGRVAYYSQVAPLSEAEKNQYATAYQPMQTLKPIELEKYLAGISFPVSKTELIDHAKLLNAGESVIYTLEQLPAKQYFGPVSLSNSLQEIS